MEDLGKVIVAKDFKKLPKVQNIAQSGHTGTNTGSINKTRVFLTTNETPQLDTKKLLNLDIFDHAAVKSKSFFIIFCFQN